MRSCTKNSTSTHMEISIHNVVKVSVKGIKFHESHGGWSTMELQVIDSDGVKTSITFFSQKNIEHSPEGHDILRLMETPDEATIISLQEIESAGAGESGSPE